MVARYLYVSFNVTQLLRGGSHNAIGARIGNGKWGYLGKKTTLNCDCVLGTHERVFSLLLIVVTVTRRGKERGWGWGILCGGGGSL